jgi:excisionase family DNA binding protein
MMLTLAEASERSGISRSGLLKAIKRGRLSAVRDDVSGQWRIDSSELFRVYAPKSEPVSVLEISAGSGSAAALEERMRSLEKLVQVLEDERNDLRRRLDAEAEERRRLTRLLTYQLEPEKPTPISTFTEGLPGLMGKLFGWRR